jgi:valyl-tRNA synthetase
MNVPPGKLVPVGIRVAGEEAQILRDMTPAVSALARIADLTVAEDFQKPHHAASAVVGSAEIHVLLEGVIDLGAERARLQKELLKAEGALERSRKKLANQDFLERAKPQVVELERQKIQQYEATHAKLERALAALED